METSKKYSAGMSAASLVFGILALVTSIAVIFTPLFAGLSITFSWLSRGNTYMSGTAKAGNILSVVSVIISIIMIIMGMMWIISMIAGANLSQYIYYIEQYIPELRELLDSIGFR